MDLCLLTYNIFGMPWRKSGIESILLWIYFKSKAEIICLQEVFSKEDKRYIEEFCKLSQWSCWFPPSNPTLLSSFTSYYGCSSGLCILTKQGIQIVEEPKFEEYKTSSFVDSFVRKGFFHLTCRKNKQIFHLINTHMQSDFTECPCRLGFSNVRVRQEDQLHSYVKNLENCILLGDFNTEEFQHFEILNSRIEVTFPQTGETLDYCLQPQDGSFFCQSTHYHKDVELSDHIPVEFSLRFL